MADVHLGNPVGDSEDDEFNCWFTWNNHECLGNAFHKAVLDKNIQLAKQEYEANKEVVTIPFNFFIPSRTFDQGKNRGLCMEDDSDSDDEEYERERYPFLSPFPHYYMLPKEWP